MNWPEGSFLALAEQNPRVCRPTTDQAWCWFIIIGTVALVAMWLFF